MSTVDCIAADRSAIAEAETLLIDLEAKRRAALLAGGHKAIDSIDTEIGTARTAITRWRERIELLDQRLAAEQDAARNAELDALSAHASKAREVGEKIIRTAYAKAAQQVAMSLAQLAAIDALIDESNRTLAKANRPTVASPNAIRQRATQRTESVERLRLGIGDALHPFHGKAEHDRGGKVRVIATGEYIEPFGEFDVPVKKTIAGIFPDALHREIKLLPAVDPEAHSFWPAHAANDRDALLRDLGLVDDKPGIIDAPRAAVSPRAA